jgi:two-component system, sensor histidine kinase LadS
LPFVRIDISISTGRELAQAHLRNPTLPNNSSALDATMKPISAAIIASLIYLSVASVSFALESVSFRSSFWVDEGRSAALTHAQKAEFTEFEGAVALGYVPHALWIKLTIEGQADVGKLAIVVRPTFLRQLALYDPEVNGASAPPVLSGRDAPLAETNHVGLDNGFVIPSSTSTRDVYLRIETTTSLTADVTVQKLEEAEYNSLVSAGFVSIYAAFLLGFVLWSLVAWGARGEHLYGLFALRQLYSLAHIFVFFGLLRFFLADSFEAEARDVIYTFISCTVAPVAGYFDVRLISELGGSRRLQRVIYVLLCMPAVTLPLVAMGQPQTALQIGSATAALQLVTMSVFAFSTQTEEAKPFGRTLVWLLRAGFVGMTVVVVLPQLMYQNVLHSSVPLFKIVFLHAAISTIILFAILSIRSRQRDLIAQEARLLVEVKEAELRQETFRRMEKERFLSMLAHELRNPLSVIELLPGADPSSVKTVRKAARDMAEVIDRVEQSERIDDGQLQVNEAEFDLSELLRQVAEHHSARDRLVVESKSQQMVVSDVGLLQRVVENLLDNAAKYSNPGSEIRVELAADIRDGQQGVQLTVVNQIGVAGQPDPERLFTKYYRAKGAHRQTGSGLGLFLVASWVAALGGAITYRREDQPNDLVLARFTVWVPR